MKFLQFSVVAQWLICESAFLQQSENPIGLIGAAQMNSSLDNLWKSSHFNNQFHGGDNDFFNSDANFLPPLEGNPLAQSSMIPVSNQRMYFPCFQACRLVSVLLWAGKDLGVR
jgi:hypothetical protein